MSIKLSNVTYTYGIGTPFEKTALYDTMSKSIKGNLSASSVIPARASRRWSRSSTASSSRRPGP